jgi:hypothetical protein
VECDDGPNQSKTEQPLSYIPDTSTDDWIREFVALTGGERPQELESDGERSENPENSKFEDTSGSAFQEAVPLLGLGGICILSWWIIM